MSKENPPQDWDKLWMEFNKSLKTWNEAFESLQRITNDVQSKYNEAIAKTLKDSNDKIMSRFIESWKKSMSDAGISAFKQIGDTGNSAAATKKEIIKTPGQTINDLITLGNSFGAHTSVLKDASNILNDSNQNNDKAAYGKLSMFINQVNQNHNLTSSQKAQLIANANTIKASIQS